MMKPGAELPAEERVRQLSEEASGVQINPDVKAVLYVKSGRELLRSAKNYEEDGNEESAFVLYTRFLTIFLERLRAHPGWKDVPAREKSLMRNYCKTVLPQAERLRVALLDKYKTEHLEYNEKLSKGLTKVNREKKNVEEKNDPDSDNLHSKWNYDWPTNLPNKKAILNSKELDVELKGKGKQIPTSGTTMLYPFEIESVPADSVTRNYDQGGTGQPVPSSSADVKPVIDRNTKPRFLSPNPTGLREIVVPGDLITVFLRCAEKNTEKNIETCGFLTGRIYSGKLVITDLIIPKQDGTPDSCAAKNEEEYIEVQDRLDLITFGWIHTHPSQTAFLSSVDMHCQFGYQQMLPEAIAIVCAPRKNQVGTFMLNPIEGMELIGKCSSQGFHTHPHTSQPLFIDAEHHHFDTSRKVNVHDLRFI